jgi:histone H3/H4
MLTSQAVEICEKSGKKTITEVEIMLALEVSLLSFGFSLLFAPNA